MTSLFVHILIEKKFILARTELRRQKRN